MRANIDDKIKDIRKVQRLLCIPLILIVCFLLYNSYSKLTYLEYKSLNGDRDACVELSEKGDRLVGEFYSPYNIIQAVAIGLDYEYGDVNSIWTIAVTERDTGKKIVEHDYTTYEIASGKIALKRNINFKSGAVYRISIQAKEVSEETAIRVWYASEQTSDLQLLFNDERLSGQMPITVYGGMRDLWWMKYTLTLVVIICATVFFFRSGKIRIAYSLLVVLFVIVILAPYSKGETFIDEFDNLCGGLVIARQGAVLYRDYISQHTPLAYYLCAVFARLGASSVQQFRLSYYLLEAVIWGGLFYRHFPVRGGKTALLPVLESLLIPVLIPLQGYQVSYDNLQGIFLVMLLLEFAAYQNDLTLSWDRCILISVGIWGSIGAAFVSVFSLQWLFVAFVITEYHRYKQAAGSAKEICLRYSRLLVSIMVPLICAVTYFASYHALGIAFRQFYSFNREVYVNYMPEDTGLGQVYVDAFKHEFCNRLYY